jgi:DNA polymerase-3 subunit alpha
VEVVHPLLQPILKNSWGEMIYQEQMMEICHDIAGFSWTETDDVKETVRFKDAARMATFKDKFLEGCATTSGIAPEIANEIWRMIESQSTYLFNRSHAWVYSLITYQTARLKYLYPLEYMTAYLATVEDDTDTHKANRQRVLAEAHEFGFQILPPDINQSMEHMCCGVFEDDQSWMRFGFMDIKGIGEAGAAKIVTRRALEPAGGFFRATEVAEVIGKGLTDKLAACGALTSIGGPRVRSSQIEEFVSWDFTDRMSAFRKDLRSQMRFPRTDGHWAQVAGELAGIVRRTTKDGRPFHVWTLRWDPATNFNVTLWETASAVWDTPLASIVTCEGKYSREWDNISVNDSTYVNVLARRRDVAG